MGFKNTLESIDMVILNNDCHGLLCTCTPIILKSVPGVFSKP